MENKKVILITEDDDSLRSVLRDKLVHDGLVVLEAKNGEEGLVIAFKEHPDLVVLDILMPKMDGMKMLEKLRADKWGKDVHVIVLTNLSDTGEFMKIKEKGSFEFFVKTNIKIEDVLVKIKEKLGII